MNSPHAARGIQEAGFTQPRTHLLADPCITSREMVMFLTWIRRCNVTSLHTSRSPSESFSLSNSSLSSQKKPLSRSPFHILQGPQPQPLCSALSGHVRSSSSSSRLTKQTNAICASQSCIHIARVSKEHVLIIAPALLKDVMHKYNSVNKEGNMRQRIDIAEQNHGFILF